MSVSSLNTLCSDFSSSFSFTAPSTSSIYTLSLHDALPIFGILGLALGVGFYTGRRWAWMGGIVIYIISILLGILEIEMIDRKSTRLNSSHRCISYAVFCLKKKKKK